MISPSRIFAAVVTVVLIAGSSLAQPAARPDRGATLNRNFLISVLS